MQLLFWRALLSLLAYDVLGFSRNFAKMHRFVSSRKIASRTAHPEAVDRVGRAVTRACTVYPKTVLCLQRSVATTCLLRSLGVPAQMVIGAQKIPFKAHAWTEVNGRAVDENRDVQQIYGVWDRC